MCAAFTLNSIVYFWGIEKKEGGGRVKRRKGVLNNAGRLEALGLEARRVRRGPSVRRREERGQGEGLETEQGSGDENERRVV